MVSAADRAFWLTVIPAVIVDTVSRQDIAIKKHGALP